MEHLQVGALGKEEEGVPHAEEVRLLDVLDELTVDGINEALYEGLLASNQQKSRAGIYLAFGGQQANASLGPGLPSAQFLDQ